jgi:predicted AAA+ superfamily ATPase
MLKHLMEEQKRAYVTLDDLELRQLANNEPAMFSQIHKPPLLIDQIQYAPELFTYIKTHLDNKYQPGDFWMTGSQAFTLRPGLPESAVDRVGLLNMSSLSQREINGLDPVPFKLDLEALSTQESLAKPLDTPKIYERIWAGDLPALISGQYTDRRNYYSNYLDTYLSRDLRNLSNSIDSLKFYNFMTATAARISCLLNVNSIASDADIDQTTAKNWLNILETLGLIFFIPPYSHNVLQRTVKTKKLYFYDTGLVCYLTKWRSPETLMAGAMNGALLENYVVSEIMKSYHNSALEPCLFYYRDRDDKEIDLLMESDGQLFPMEIKKTANPSKILTKPFKVIEKSPLKRGTGAVLCLSERLSAFDRENLIVPIWLI